MGTSTVPLSKDMDDQNHYVYIDGTFNLWSQYATDIANFDDKDRQIVNYLEGIAYHNVKHIFSISEYVKRDLIDYYGIHESKITVVGTGSGIIKPFFGDKNLQRIKLLFVAKGRFADKGGFLVLKIFEGLLAHVPDIELTIVGQNDYSDKIQHPSIKTYGFVDADKLQRIFESHTIFLMPAINEPWGLVYIEALLCKMPIVGLNRNSFPELSKYGECGIFIDEQNYLATIDKLLPLIKNPVKIIEMGNVGQDFALQTFSWDITANKIAKEINK